MRLATFIFGLAFCPWISAATLEKLTIEQMAKESTLIVRGKVTGCTGEARGRIIYTRCGVAVSESWKGSPGSRVDFIVPGGTARTLTQTYTGTPKFNPNEQYVLFLWVGRSGVPQIIGLSQGVFDVSQTARGVVTVRREATSEVMLNAKGEPVRDESISLSLAELERRVAAALGQGAGQ